MSLSKNVFLIRYLKLLSLSFGVVACFVPRSGMALLEIILSHLLLTNKKNWVQRPPGIFQHVEKDLLKGSLVSISSESLNIYPLIKVWSISGPNLFQNSLLCADDFLLQHLEHLPVNNATLSYKAWSISTLSMLVYLKTNNFFLLLKMSHAVVCSVSFQRF